MLRRNRQHKVCSPRLGVEPVSESCSQAIFLSAAFSVMWVETSYVSRCPMVSGLWRCKLQSRGLRTNPHPMKSRPFCYRSVSYAVLLRVLKSGPSRQTNNDILAKRPLCWAAPLAAPIHLAEPRKKLSYNFHRELHGDFR